jgi:hypothetical protein
MSTQAQAIITLTVDDEKYGIWDKLTGGEVDSETLKYKPGNMGAPITLGGSVEVGDLTVSRLFLIGRDTEIINKLIGRVGKADCVVARSTLDPDGNVWSSGALVYKGKLKTVTPPELDSESSDAALLELVISPSGTVGTVSPA